MNNETFAMFRQSDEFEPNIDANKVMIASAFDDFLRRIVKDTANMSILEEEVCLKLAYADMKKVFVDFIYEEYGLRYFNDFLFFFRSFRDKIKETA